MNEYQIPEKEISGFMKSLHAAPSMNGVMNIVLVPGRHEHIQCGRLKPTFFLWAWNAETEKEVTFETKKRVSSWDKIIPDPYEEGNYLQLAEIYIRIGVDSEIREQMKREIIFENGYKIIFFSANE